MGYRSQCRLLYIQIKKVVMIFISSEKVFFMAGYLKNYFVLFFIINFPFIINLIFFPGVFSGHQAAAACPVCEVFSFQGNKRVSMYPTAAYNTIATNINMNTPTHTAGKLNRFPSTKTICPNPLSEEMNSPPTTEIKARPILIRNAEIIHGNEEGIIILAKI